MAEDLDDTRTFAERQLPPHLGGHFGNSNVDTATLDYLISRFAITTMLDVGCGPGGQIEAALARGVAAFGIDGDPHMRTARIWTHDYTSGPWPTAGWDLIWSVEFVEHVEAKYQENYLVTFDGGKVLFLTAAPPGFPGWHHVNCQPQSYWLKVLTKRGWTRDHEATEWVRAHGGHPFSTRQGLVFVKS